MAKILDMPKLSPTMEEGVLTAWHKKEGDAIKVDDLLAEVETDKATMEFRSFDDGTLLKLLVPAGSTVKLGQAVAVLGAAGEDVAELVAKAGGGGGATEAPKKEEASKPDEAPSKEEAPKPEPATEKEQAPKPGATAPKDAAPPKLHTGSALSRTERDAEAAPAPEGRVLASPYVRKTARELGLDLSKAQGSGPHGRIVAEDLNALKESAPPPGTGLARTQAPALASGLAAPEVRPLSPMRKTIARRLTESKQTVPHFYLTIDVDAGALLALRESINRDLASESKTDKPLKVSVNDLLIKACATALRRVPECNATFTPEALLVHQRVDISVAVAIADGLVTPVLRDADKKSVVEIAQEVRELAARARSKKLKLEEMQEGTFSISNLGMFGIDAFSAVINPPEGAILAVGQARDEAVVQNGVIVAGKKLSMTLSCDHRVIDGSVGASFLAELRALIERPMRILTG